MSLPHASWTSVASMAFELKGPLREGTVSTSAAGEHVLQLEEFARFSDKEVYDFWPDCAAEFPAGGTRNFTFLHCWHYPKEQPDGAGEDWPEYVDVYLVLQKMETVQHTRPRKGRKREKGVNKESGRLNKSGEIRYAVEGEEGEVTMKWNETDARDDETEELYAARTFRRVGYMEARYEVRRDYEGINEDMWWRAIRLL
ncbi:hypothetical protein G7046_g6549 [Stylonectria norvegica]|nr:hypothetical protein G7046_g6549 [Stylonectria norvegica]